MPAIGLCRQCGSEQTETDRQCRRCTQCGTRHRRFDARRMLQQAATERQGEIEMSTKNRIVAVLSNYLETGIDPRDIAIAPDPMVDGVFAVRYDTGAPGNGSHPHASDATDGPRYLEFIVRPERNDVEEVMFTCWPPTARM